MEKELEDWYNLHKFYLYSGSYETKDLANFLGVSSRTIQRWLKERTKPSEKQIVKIRSYLAQKKLKSPL